MTYMMRRRFQGSAPDVTELDRTIARELVPKFKAIPGFIRYFTIAFDDGTVGSMTVVEDENAVQHCQDAARRWASEAPAMKGMKPVDAISAKMVARIIAVDSNAPGFSIFRHYRSDASEHDLEEAFGQPLRDAFQQKVAGLVRYGVWKLPDGKVVTSGWFDTAEHAAASSQVARELIGAHPNLAKAFPTPPEHVLTGRMLSVYT